MAADCADTVSTNAVIIDHWGIVKADIAIKNGLIAGIGKARQPGHAAGRDHRHRPRHGNHCGRGHDRHGRRHRHATPLHLPAAAIDEALTSGVTTMIGGGTGPATGTFATTVTPGPWHMERMLQAVDGYPMNIGLLGKGNASQAAPLREQIAAGAIGLKLHEDWGSTPAAHRLLPGRGRRDRHPGRHPHRHAQRGRLRRGHGGRLQGPHHPHLPHRRRGRRPRARHHQGLRRGNVLPSSTNPHAALHGEHAGRAPGHAHGLPPPGCLDCRDIAFAESASAARPSPPRTCCTTWAPSP